MQRSGAVVKLQRPLISKLVQDYIRDYIVNHSLRPGDALPYKDRSPKICVLVSVVYVKQCDRWNHLVC